MLSLRPIKFIFQCPPILTSSTWMRLIKSRLQAMSKLMQQAKILLALRPECKHKRNAIGNSIQNLLERLQKYSRQMQSQRGNHEAQEQPEGEDVLKSLADFISQSPARDYNELATQFLRLQTLCAELQGMYSMVVSRGEATTRLLQMAVATMNRKPYYDQAQALAN